ncbi:MAG: SGNH/GDSL hydrolase family protein [Anaerolineae bacterium]|nr:SGNH/GDSL hydrolase family protein [Anaerolineae bacterium]
MPPAWTQRSDDRLPFFKTFRLGPVLAYNLCQSGTSTLGREKLFEVLEQVVPLGSRVLLVFGEIDCRAHLIRQSQQQNKPIEAIVKHCVDRYFSVALEIRDLGYQVMIWNAPPTTMTDISSEVFPTVGSPQERNHVTRLFNQVLDKHCIANDIPFISIFDQIVDEDNQTDMSYLMDIVHLSQRAMPLAIEELKPLVPEIDFDDFDWEAPYYKLPMKKYRLAIITPSYIGSSERANYARRSLESLRDTFGQHYAQIVVDDVPHFNNRLLKRFPDWRYSNLAEKIYQGENIRLIRQHGRSSVTATLRATHEARRTGYELVFIHLDDMVYIPQARDLMAHAVDAFCRVPDLQMVRLTGIPILSHACTPELGNRTELTIAENSIQFENLTLQAQRFDDYTLWWSSFHADLMQGRYYAIPMWFTLFRASFLEKLLTLNDTVANLQGLGQVELYYKDMDNWREALQHIDGKLGYINMQFGGLEMQRNENWQTLIHLPNEAIR